MSRNISKQELIDFEKEVADAFEAGKIKGPIHLSGGNEDELIELFQCIRPYDWVFSTWRNHYHALLHGIPREEVMRQIMAGRGMNMHSREYNFYSSAIVGGTLPIAVGLAAGLKIQDDERRWNLEIGEPLVTSHVWCFVGDMVASMGLFQDALHMAAGLPITFVVEDNGLCTNTPTINTWPSSFSPLPDVYRYKYERRYPHTGIGKWVQL